MVDYAGGIGRFLMSLLFGLSKKLHQNTVFEAEKIEEFKQFETVKLMLTDYDQAHLDQFQKAYTSFAAKSKPCFA